MFTQDRAERANAGADIDHCLNIAAPYLVILFLNANRDVPGAGEHLPHKNGIGKGEVARCFCVGDELGR